MWVGVVNHTVHLLTSHSLQRVIHTLTLHPVTHSTPSHHPHTHPPPRHSLHTLTDSPMVGMGGDLLLAIATACFMMSLSRPRGVDLAAPDPFLPSPCMGVGSGGRARDASTWNTLHPPEQCSLRAAAHSSTAVHVRVGCVYMYAHKGACY